MFKLFKFDISDAHYTLIGLGAFVRVAAVALMFQEMFSLLI